MGAYSFVEAAEDQDRLAVYGHAHSEVASCPSRLRVQIDHTPHVVIDIIHLNRVSNFLLVELGAATKDIDVLIVEDAAGCGVSRHI